MTRKEKAQTKSGVRRPPPRRPGAKVNETYTGLKLPKPKVLTLKMLEQWDVCYEGHAWFKARGTSVDLDDKSIQKFMEQVRVGDRFKTVWLITLCNMILGRYALDVKTHTARVAINNVRADFVAQVTAVNLQDLPSDVLLAEQIRLMCRLAHIIRNL